jgi:hypothetical protein
MRDSRRQFFNGSGSLATVSPRIRCLMQKHETRAEDNRDFQGTELIFVFAPRKGLITIRINQGIKQSIIEKESYRFTSKNLSYPLLSSK